MTMLDDWKRRFGRPQQPFEAVCGRLLVDVHTDEPGSEHDEVIAAGRLVPVELLPGGDYYVLHPHFTGTCILANPVEGEHFTFLEVNDARS